jgi:CRP/FNR family transcriptional regulator, dissimilatory nitrate respiration regulator
MEKILEIISKISLFSGLSDAELRQIRQIAVDKRFEKGEAIFFEGDDANGFYLVVDGRVKIYKLSTEGKEQILHLFGAGEPFGEVPVFSGQAFPANADAVSKSRLLFFPRTDFVELITNNPSLALNMLAVLSMRLRQFTVQIESLSLKEVPGRLAAYLIYLAEEQNAGDCVALPAPKTQLASLLGTIPETLSRIFSKMSSQELILVDGRQIKLLDREGLQALAEHGRIME